MKIIISLFYLVFALSILWPFSIMYKVDGIPALTPDRIPLFLLAFAILNLFVTAQLNFYNKNYRKYIHLTILMFAWSIVSSIFGSKEIFTSVFATINWYLIGPLLGITLFLIIKNTNKLIYIIKLFVILMLIINILGTMEMIINKSLFSNLLISINKDILLSIQNLERDGLHRVRSVFVSPLVYAQFLTLVLPLNFYLYKTSTNNLFKLILLINILLSFLMSYFTGSRAGLFLIIFSLFLFYHFQFTAYSHLYKRITKYFIIMIIPISYYYLSESIDNIIKEALALEKNYIAGLVEEKEASTLSRILQIIIGYKMFLESPIFGYGNNMAYSIMKLGGHPHIDNYYLGNLLDKGVFGLLLIILYIVFIIKIGLSIIKDYKDTLTIALLASFICIVFYYFILTINKADIMLYIIGALIIIREEILIKKRME